MEVLITICGRAGSKGAKNKNFRLFLGKPLIYYTIKSAKLFKKNRRQMERVSTNIRKIYLIKNYLLLLYLTSKP